MTSVKRGRRFSAKSDEAIAIDGVHCLLGIYND